MYLDDGRIIGYEDVAHITPFFSLANPLPEYKEMRCQRDSKRYKLYMFKV